MSGYKRNIGSRLLGWGSFALAIPALALAQSGVTLQGELSERLSQSVPVSGTLVAGMAIGPTAGLAGLNAIRIPLSGAGDSVCFRATTRDGVYSASGRFEAPTGARGMAGLPRESRYADQLRGYQRTQFAAVARESSECGPAARGAFVPVSYGSGERLTVALLARAMPGPENVAVTLTDPAGRASTGTCGADRTERSTSFDTVCSINLTGLSRSGLARLQVARREPAGRWIRTEVQVRLSN